MKKRLIHGVKPRKFKKFIDKNKWWKFDNWRIYGYDVIRQQNHNDFFNDTIFLCTIKFTDSTRIINVNVKADTLENAHNEISKGNFNEIK